jgi:hypothetical protein
MPASSTRVDRCTVDLSSYPDLVVIYLGMRVNRLAGLKLLLGIGPQIGKSAADKPAGLLRHEFFFLSFFPAHVGMRQYWRDPDSLIRWTAPTPTASGGKTSCAIPAAPASGTKPISTAAVWKPSMTTCPPPSASPPSRLSYPHAAPCSPLPPAPTFAPPQLPSSPNPTCIIPARLRSDASPLPRPYLRKPSFATSLE